MESSYCKDCNISTMIVFNRATGDTICSECGLVLDSHYIDEKDDWRTFTPLASKDDNYDPISTVKFPNNLKSRHNSTPAMRFDKNIFDHHNSFRGNIQESVDFSSHQADNAIYYIADMADR